MKNLSFALPAAALCLLAAAVAARADNPPAPPPPSGNAGAVSDPCKSTTPQSKPCKTTTPSGAIAPIKAVGIRPDNDAGPEKNKIKAERAEQSMAVAKQKERSGKADKKKVEVAGEHKN